MDLNNFELLIKYGNIDSRYTQQDVPTSQSKKSIQKQ